METTASVLSQRILRMEESATIKMSQMARELGAQGHKVISLSLGEPDFDTPDHIKEAAKAALDEGFTKYTPVPGVADLRDAISAKFKKDNGLDYAPNQIVVSNGAKQCLADLSLALLDEGDEVIILAPFWVSYTEIVKMGGGTPVVLTAGIEDDFKVSAEAIKAAITPKTKMIMFSSPCNPTGSVYEYDELKAIADVVAQYPDVYIVSDEIYELINFTGKHVSIGSFDNVKDQTVTINGFSKGYSMTGWRLGYLGAPLHIAKACTKIQGQVTSGACSFGQKAAVTALTGTQEPVNVMREAFRKRKGMMVEMLGAIPGVKVNNPQGAFYIFPDVSDYFGKSDGETTVNNSSDLALYILDKAHVSVVTGEAFGAPECVRLSYAASEETLIEAIDRIKGALAKLS